MTWTSFCCKLKLNRRKELLHTNPIDLRQCYISGYLIRDLTLCSPSHPRRHLKTNFNKQFRKFHMHCWMTLQAERHQGRAGHGLLWLWDVIRTKSSVTQWHSVVNENTSGHKWSNFLLTKDNMYDNLSGLFDELLFCNNMEFAPC